MTMQRFDDIKGYGCWCSFDGMWRTGHGAPMDEYDTLCRQLHNCYKCAAIDGDNAGSNCEAAVEAYVLPNKKANLHSHFHNRCSRVNRGNLCAIRACTCETFFVVEILEKMMKAYDLNPTFVHDHGGFSRDSDCGRVSSAESEKECCGYYPLRFPYPTEDGNKQCCYDKVYDANEMGCCPGGILKQSCQNNL